jgi:hypothetical protein
VIYAFQSNIVAGLGVVKFYGTHASTFMSSIFHLPTAVTFGRALAKIKLLAQFGQVRASGKIKAVYRFYSTAGLTTRCHTNTIIVYTIHINVAIDLRTPTHTILAFFK